MHTHPSSDRMADIMIFLQGGKSQIVVSHDEAIGVLHCTKCKAIRDLLLAMHNPTRERMIELVEKTRPYLHE